MSATDALLEEAHRILSEDREWCQGAYVTDDAVCVMGALIRAALQVRLPLGSFAEAIHRVTLGAEIDLGTPLATWNDDPSRTKEDVLLALKRARYDFGGDE